MIIGHVQHQHAMRKEHVLHYTALHLPIMKQNISATTTTRTAALAPGRGPLDLATKHELVELQLRLSPLAHVARLV